MFTVIAALEATTKRNEKKAILLNNQSDLLKKIINYALDPYRVFYLRKFDTYTKPEGFIPSLKFDSPELWKLLDDLSARKVTGHAGLEAHKNVASKLSNEEEELLRRVILKDLRCGVSTSTANDVFPDCVPEFNVMLAEKYDKDTAMFPAYAEPKIDGIRTRATLHGSTVDSIVYQSRSGKEFETLDHLSAELLECFPPGAIIEGETKTLTGSFQTSIGAVSAKKNKKTDVTIGFVMFDIFTVDEEKRQDVLMTYDARQIQLASYLSAYKAKNPGTLLTILERKVVKNHEDVMNAYGEFLEAGHEGAMVKIIDGRYEFKRSTNWLKVKPVETVDLEIIGFEEGNGRNEGRLGYVHVNFEGRACRVGTGFKDEMREEIWNNKSKYMGAIAEIKYTEKTDDGSMRHNRFIKMRTFKGEKF